MRFKGGIRVSTVMAVVALLGIGVGMQAATTVTTVQLGDRFSGTIGVSGEDFVEARFAAPQGAEVRLTLQATGNSTLRPTVMVTDAGGVQLTGVKSQNISWLPSSNLITYFTVPASGTYVAVIGGSSGSGGFWAHLSGTPYESPMASVSGTVTDSLTGAAVSGATVLVDDTLFGSTDSSGHYSGELEAGTYSVTFQADGYQSSTESLTVSAGTSVVLDVSLVPLVPVTVEIEVSGDEVPGGSLTAFADIQAPPGTTINSVNWTQEYGVPAGVSGADTDTATVILGSEGAYRDEIIHLATEPPVGEDDLPPNVHLPDGEFFGGLQDRLQVVGLNPFTLEEAGLVILKVEVVTDLGTYTAEEEVHTALPWGVSTGLRNVPVGRSILLHAAEQASYSWTLATPPGSLATLNDASSQSPYFTPDVPGLYELELSDGAGGLSTLQVYSGTWRGVIVDQDIDGRPVADTACTFCHNGVLVEDNFTDWAQTGHAEIFTNNLNTSTHYGPNCFACHTVGFDTDTDNEGFDEAEDYQAFIDAGLLNNPGDNWTTMLADHPDAARKANIQCENCHGPQDSNAHGFAGPLGEPRMSLSSDVCATCHGEPLRHARFQQWQLSAHANYELAVDEGDSGNCSRCHTANGFLTWLPILLDDDPETDPTDSITVNWEPDEVHPQTCAACHDPHAEGTTSGSNTNATVRISGDTPPLIAGFQVTDVGRGAICMTCHNSRRGLRNDDTFGDLSSSERARAPHGSAQTDVLVGQNAYLVEVGNRGGHSYIEDSCVSCHMEETDPPDLLAYNLGGTNHTFFASEDICSNCHSAYLKASDVQDGIQHLMDQVENLMEEALYDLIDDLTTAGNTIDMNGEATITDADQISEIQFGETRGRQAMAVTLTTGETVGLTRMTDIDVIDPGGTIIGILYDFADDGVIKAGWNWNLFNNDGSQGVHNPFFANGALIAARDTLVEVSGASMDMMLAPAPAVPEVDSRVMKPLREIKDLEFKKIKMDRSRRKVER